MPKYECERDNDMTSPTIHTDRPCPRRHTEEGAALVMAIISLFLITGLATAMLTSARTEFLIANNEERAVHARMAAEAGLNHAVQVVADRLTDWQSLGFASAQLAVTDLIDDGSLAGLGLPAPTAATTLTATTSYRVRVYDDYDNAAARKISPALVDADRVRMQEDTVVTTDLNRRLVVHATGLGPGNTTATLEAVVGPVILPAVISNGNMSIGGNAQIVGANGSVHANGNLDMSGSSGTITNDCTSSGSFSGAGSNCGGTAGGGRPNVTVPNIQASDYLAQATFILQSDGRIWRNSTSSIVCDASSNSNACRTAGYGWMFSSGTWSLGSTEPPNGAYYVQGDVVTTGSPGSAGTPVVISIIAEGYVNISGSPDFRPFLPETFIVTNKDLEITGSLTQPINVEGQVLVRDQLKIHGNATLAGQVIVQDASTACTLVTSNSISGSVSITYNGMVNANNFAVLGWKEVR